MRLLKPLALAMAVIATVAAFEAAAAAAVPTTAARLGAGTAAVAACDTDGFTFRFTVDSTGHITSVVVGAMAGTCAGGTLRLTLANGTTSVGSGTASLPASGFTGSASISVSPTPLSNGVTAVHVVIEGP